MKSEEIDEPDPEESEETYEIDPEESEEFIEYDPKESEGPPYFDGTNVPLMKYFEYIILGDGLEAFLRDYPMLNRKEVYAMHEYLGKLVSAKPPIQNNGMKLSGGVPESHLPEER